MLQLTRAKTPNIRAYMGRLALVRAVGLGARDHLLVPLLFDCQLALHFSVPQATEV